MVKQNHIQNNFEWKIRLWFLQGDPIILAMTRSASIYETLCIEAIMNIFISSRDPSKNGKQGQPG